MRHAGIPEARGGFGREKKGEKTVHRRMRISRSARMAAVMLLTGMILMGCGGLKGGIYVWEPGSEKGVPLVPRN